MFAYETVLVRLAESYASARGLTVATVSLYAAGQGRLFERLRNGASITTRRAARIVQWFSDHWPGDAAWPADIPRPAPSPDSPAARPPEPVDDPLAATVAALEDVDAAMLADDWDAARRHEDRMFAAALTLRPDGCLASVEALCRALRVRRTVVDDVVRRYADGRGGGRPRSQKSDTARVLAALVQSGDVRFQSRRPAA